MSAKTNPLIQAMRDSSYSSDLVLSVIQSGDLSKQDINAAFGTLFCFLSWREYDDQGHAWNCELARVLLENGADPNLHMHRYDQYNVLQIAAERGNLEMVELLLSFGADPNCELYNSNHALGMYGEEDSSYVSFTESLLYHTLKHFAGGSRGIEVAEILISHGADVNSDYNGEFRRLNMRSTNETALHHAVRKRHENVVRFLLSNGADPNQTNERGETSLFLAPYHPVQDNVIFDLLLAHGARIDAKDGRGGTILVRELGRRSTMISVVQKFISYGADLNASSSPYTSVYFDNDSERLGMTSPLWVAIYKCNAELVKLLLGEGCWTPDAKTESGGSSIGILLGSICGKESASSIFKMVLETMSLKCKMDGSYHQFVSIVNGGYSRHKSTLLHRALQKGDSATVSVLISYGADARIKDRYSMTPLHSIIFSEIDNCYDIISSLFDEIRARKELSHSVEDVLNEVDRYGQTPLHYAAKSTSQDAPSIISLLVENGARMQALDNKGKTPLMAATEGVIRLPNVRQLLESSGFFSRQFHSS